MPRPGRDELVMQVVGRMTAITCKCGATIICPTKTRLCVKEHIVYVDANDEHLNNKEDNENADVEEGNSKDNEFKVKNTDVKGNSKDKEITINKSRRSRVLVTDGLCVVCMSNPPQAVCVPCGHLVTCMDCISKINRWLCLICRAPVEQIVKVYTV